MTVALIHWAWFVGGAAVWLLVLLGTVALCMAAGSDPEIEDDDHTDGFEHPARIRYRERCQRRDDICALPPSGDERDWRWPAGTGTARVRGDAGRRGTSNSHEQEEAMWAES